MNSKNKGPLPQFLLSFYFKSQCEEERLQEHKENVNFNWCALGLGYKLKCLMLLYPTSTPLC